MRDAASSLPMDAMPVPSSTKLIDFGLLQVGWFACVAGAALGHELLGPLYVVAALAVHLCMTDDARRDVIAMGVALVLGLAGDSLMVLAGVVVFPDARPGVGALPLWMIALWPLFGMTFHTTLGWLRARPGWAAALGAVGGPPGYFAADGFGSLSLPAGAVTSCVALSLFWGVTLPLAQAVSARLAHGRRGRSVAA